MNGSCINNCEEQEHSVLSARTISAPASQVSNEVLLASPSSYLLLLCCSPAASANRMWNTEPSLYSPFHVASSNWMHSHSADLHHTGRPFSVDPHHADHVELQMVAPMYYNVIQKTQKSRAKIFYKPCGKHVKPRCTRHFTWP